MREAGDKGLGVYILPDECFVALCHEGLMEDLPDSFEASDDLVAAVASLNVRDYLQSCRFYLRVHVPFPMK